MAMRKISLACSAAALCVGAWHLVTSSEQAELASAEHLVDRVWIERMPENDRDIVFRFVPFRTDQGRFGIFGHGSVWRHRLEVFRWALEGKRLVLVLPQERQRTALDVRTWDCEREAPKPFQLCAELSRGDKKLKLFSRHDWVVRPGDADALDEAIVHDVAPMLAQIEAIDPRAGEDFEDINDIMALPEVDFDLDTLTSNAAP